MKKLSTALLLAALLPLAGCATPYGYSSGAYAGYDGGFDSVIRAMAAAAAAMAMASPAIIR